MNYMKYFHSLNLIIIFLHINQTLMKPNCLPDIQRDWNDSVQDDRVGEEDENGDHGGAADWLNRNQRVPGEVDLRSKQRNVEFNAKKLFQIQDKLD